MDELADFLIGGSAIAVPARATTAVAKSATTTIDFRVEFFCKRGNHYAKMLRGRGKKRTASLNNYKYLGEARVIAARGGYYASRYLEYSAKHKCSYE